MDVKSQKKTYFCFWRIQEEIVDGIFEKFGFFWIEMSEMNLLKLFLSGHKKLKTTTEGLKML